MGQHHADGGYSADVRITLTVGEFNYNVSHLGRDELVLRQARQVKAGTRGTLIVVVDGEEERIEVELFEAVNPLGVVKFKRLPQPSEG